MATYRVIAKTFINNELIDPETMPDHKCVVEYDGIPGTTLELIDGEASASADDGEGKASAKKKWTPKAKAAAGEDAV